MIFAFHWSWRVACCEVIGFFLQIICICECNGCEYLKIIFVNCGYGLKCESDRRSNEYYLRSSENKGLIFTTSQVVLTTAKITFIFTSLSAVTCMIFIYFRSFIHNFRGWFGSNLVTSYCKDHGFKTLTGLNFSSGLIFTTVQLGFITARITFIFKYVSVLIFSSLVKIIT